MEYKYLGRTKERISAIGIGTWQLDLNEKAAHEIVCSGVDNGINLIDTAEIYGTEGIVGKVLDRIGRDDIHVASKVWPNHFHYQDLIDACNGSLKRLGIKQIWLYQLHYPNYTVPIEDTMSALEHLQKEGKIRHIGVSNFSAKELEDAQAALNHGEVVSNQVEYSILMREHEEDGLVDYCKRNNITLIAYSPLGEGQLYERRNAALLSGLDAIGEPHGKTGTQVALNWLISKKPVVAIPKASSAKHMAENAGAATFNLTEGAIGKVDELSKGFSKRPLMGRHVRKLLKHTTFWHGIAARRYGHDQ